jgi:short-subunit dehydrogenase
VKGKALLVGNSDGIGLAATREHLKQDWKVPGISRSQSPLKDSSYRHIAAEVQAEDYLETLTSVLEKNEAVDLCIYCAGIGELLNPSDMKEEAKIIEVNLLGMVKTASLVIPAMVQSGKGHFIGLSSLACETVYDGCGARRTAFAVLH